MKTKHIIKCKHLTIGKTCQVFEFNGEKLCLCNNCAKKLFIEITKQVWDKINESE